MQTAGSTVLLKMETSCISFLTTYIMLGHMIKWRYAVLLRNSIAPSPPLLPPRHTSCHRRTSCHSPARRDEIRRGQVCWEHFFEEHFRGHMPAWCTLPVRGTEHDRSTCKKAEKQCSGHLQGHSGHTQSSKFSSAANLVLTIQRQASMEEDSRGGINRQTQECM